MPDNSASGGEILQPCDTLRLLVSTGEKNNSKDHAPLPAQPSGVWKPEAWNAAVQKREQCQLCTRYLKAEEEFWVLKIRIREKEVVKGLSGMSVEETRLWMQH
jgi:hypothetical protein